MRASRIRVLLSTSVLALGFVAGCGSSDTAAPDTPAPDTPAPGAAAPADGPTTTNAKACTLVTIDEATQALGGARLTVFNDSDDGCTYGNPDNTEQVDVKVEDLEYRPDVVDLVKSSLEPSATKPLDGLGQAAFSYQPADGVTQNYVWGKGKFLQISVTSDAAKTADGAKKLIETAFGRL